LPIQQLNIGIPTKIFDGKKITVRYNEIDLDEFFDEKKANEYLKKLNKDKTFFDAEVSKSQRKFAIGKHLNKFEIFFKHFDGEILIRSKKGKQYFEAQGAHNFLVNGEKIRIRTIRKPPGLSFDNLPDDTPFIANVDLKYSNRYLPKKSTSSFFPKNWSIERIQEEVALVYEQMIKNGKTFHPKSINRKFDYKNSDGTFRIQIEFDNQGNFTNAYPINI